MANAVMVSSSSKTLIPSMVGPTTTPLKQQSPSISIGPTSNGKHFLAAVAANKLLSSLPSLKPTAAIAAATASINAFLLTSPSLASEMEKAALFDFNLTLPAIALEFLLLMVALDKIYFTPLGKFMDNRDAAIREKLSSFKDTSEEVKQLEEQAAAVMKAARAEISAALNKMKKETSLELDQKLSEGRRKVEAELAEALQNLERQKEETIKSLDSQIAALSDEIVKKVLPI